VRRIRAERGIGRNPLSELVGNYSFQLVRLVGYGLLLRRESRLSVTLVGCDYRLEFFEREKISRPVLLAVFAFCSSQHRGSVFCADCALAELSCYSNGDNFTRFSNQIERTNGHNPPNTAQTK